MALDPSGTAQDVCFLCEKPMAEADSRAVGELAIRTLREASVRRQDERRRAHLDGLPVHKRNALGVHRACQAAYLAPAGLLQPNTCCTPQQKTTAATSAAAAAGSATAARKRPPKAGGGGRAQSRRAAKSAAFERIKSDPALSARARSLSLDLYNFDFTTMCFVCGGPADGTGRRTYVQHVSSDTVRTDILRVIENQPSNNQYVEEIYRRLKPVDDLTKVCGRYHSDCLARLYRYQNFVPKRAQAARRENEAPANGNGEGPRDDGKKENEGGGEMKKSRL